MSNIRFRAHNVGATLSEATTVQFVEGSGEVLGMSVDYAAAADAGTVVSLYDGKGQGLAATGGDLIYTIASVNTDFGTTVPVRLFQNGRLISGTSTNNVHSGLPFFDGLRVAVTLDVTGPQLVRIWYRPLIRKDANLLLNDSTTTGHNHLFSGVGLFKAAKVLYNPLIDVGSVTTDLTFYDGVDATGRAFQAVANSLANWNTSANMAVATTTCHDEAGTAVTTAANAHENDGVLFYTGLAVGVAQTDTGTVGDKVADIAVLIEA